MFVQIVHAPARVDEGSLPDLSDRLHEALASGGAGWQWAVAGVTAGGQAVAAAAFDVPPQGAWWDCLEPLLAGPGVVEESGDVHVVGDGPPPRTARFVQMMRSRVSDRGRMEAIEDDIGPRFQALRPDFLYGLRAWHGDDRVTVIDWFTSEDEARAGERVEFPDEVKEGFGQWLSLLDDTAWYDLVDPWQGAAPDRS